MVIKMKDLIKAQTDELRKKFIWNEGVNKVETCNIERTCCNDCKVEGIINDIFRGE